MSKKIIGTLAFVLALGLNNCEIKDLRKYDFEGKIGEDLLSFCYRDLSFCSSPYSMLTITKPDGRIITCIDSKQGDLKLDYVAITKEGQTKRYTRDDYVGEAVMKEAQKQFDSYLEKIIEIKASQALKDLK